MMQRISLIAAVLLAGCVLTACSRHRGGSPASTGPAEGFLSEALPSVSERGSICADVTALESYPTPDGTQPESLTPILYQQLDAATCRGRAAAHAWLAGILNNERRLLGSVATDGDQQQACAAGIHRRVLAFGAQEDRNRAAAAALEAFYLLAEAEFGSDMTRQALEESQRAIDHFKQLREQGFEVHIDGGLLRRQHLALLDRRVELQTSIRQLNGRLGQLLGLDADDGTPLWPAADLTVDVEPINVEQAVDEGMAHRADVGVIVMLRRRLTKDSLAGVRRALARVDGLIGGPFPAGAPLGVLKILRTLCGDGDDDCELAMRRAQLDRLLVARSEAATAEIRQAVHQIDDRLKRTALARDMLIDHERELKRVTDKHEATDASTFEVSAAQLNVLRARSELVHQVVAWKIAKMKLRQAQGLLAVDCGYVVPR